MGIDHVTWQDRIRAVSPATYSDLAWDLFQWQFQENPVYQAYCQFIGRTPTTLSPAQPIPALPLDLFKSCDIRSGIWPEEQVFTSSGTTGQKPSRHMVAQTDWYLEVARWCFRETYGNPADYAWLALLPGYLEREGSSLIVMAEHFIRTSRYPESGFYLRDIDALLECMDTLRNRQIPIILLGVTFALLALGEQTKADWGSDVLVMETGGIKGRGPELIRTEVHERLGTALGVPAIHSEYGMTELFSQAYAPAAGRFYPPSTMRVRARELTDPFTLVPEGKTGVLEITDLANYATCAFLSTQDLGRVFPDGSFEVLGRTDGSDIRGCNLLVSDLSFD